MTVPRDPRLIARIVEMRDAGMTHEERAMYRDPRTRKPVNTRMSVSRAFEAVLKAKRGQRDIW